MACKLRAPAAPPPNSPGVPLPQSTQMRVPLPTSLPTLTVGLLRCQAGPPPGPHIAIALKPPACFIAKPTSMGHIPLGRFKKPDSDPA